jgi:hypothetical protein
MDEYILAVLMDFIGLRSGKQHCMIYCERQATYLQRPLSNQIHDGLARYMDHRFVNGGRQR